MNIPSVYKRHLLPALAALPLLLSAAVYAEDEESPFPDMTRVWTSKGTNSTIEAKIEKVGTKDVTLRRTDNKRSLVIALDKLSDEDVAWVEENREYIGKSEKELKAMFSSTKIGKDLKGKTKGLVNGEWTSKEIKPTAKYFIVYFSASWCPPCRAGAPHSVSVYKDKVAKMPGLEVVMKNVDHSEDKAIEWAKKEKMPWPFLYKDNIDAFQKVSPRGIPNMKLLDGDGNLIQEGSMDSLVAKAKELLGKEK